MSEVSSAGWGCGGAGVELGGDQLGWEGIGAFQLADEGFGAELA